MTQATLSLEPSRSNESRLVAAVCAAHFISHYFIIILPPLFGSVKAEYDVTYTQLGFALTLFNVVGAVLQTPAGFLVDRMSARVVLIVGVLCGAVAFAVVGLVDSFWVLIAMFALAGLGNTVYHPADYALLANHVPPDRIGQAFSLHTFAGMLGGAVAPASLLFMQGLWGWRGAFIGSAVLGFVIAAILVLQREPAPLARPLKADTKASDKQGAASPDGWRLLMTAPILVNLAFFIFMAIANSGFQNYSVVALGDLHGTSLALANTALTAYLMLGALGVLVGGLLVGRTTRHGLVSVVGLLVSGAFGIAVGLFDAGSFALIMMMSLAGLFSGVFLPSRDMLVREATPPGAFGKVFGFVTTGFNIGGVIAPVVFGLVLDHGSPRAVFLLIGLFSLLAIATVAVLPRRRPA